MAFVPIPKEPTANKDILLKSTIDTFANHIKARDHIELALAQKKLKAMSINELNSLYEEYIKTYDPSATFYIQRSLEICYGEDLDSFFKTLFIKFNNSYKNK